MHNVCMPVPSIYPNEAKIRRSRFSMPYNPTLSFLLDVTERRAGRREPASFVGPADTLRRRTYLGRQPSQHGLNTRSESAITGKLGGISSMQSVHIAPKE